MDNQTTKRNLLTEISEFRKLAPTVDNITILNQFRLIQELVDDLQGKSSSERDLFLEVSNVVHLFSSKDQAYFLKATNTDNPQKTAALARLQEWAKRAGELLEDH